MEEQYKGGWKIKVKSITPHVDRLTMDEDYQGHHIQSVPRNLPDSNRWTAHVVINWTVRSREQFREFDVKSGFATQEDATQEDATQEDAELGGLIVAKKWIDDGKPPLRERGAGSS